MLPARVRAVPGQGSLGGNQFIGIPGGVREQKVLCSSLCESYKFKTRADKAAIPGVCKGSWLTEDAPGAREGAQGVGRALGPGWPGARGGGFSRSPPPHRFRLEAPSSPPTHLPEALPSLSGWRLCSERGLGVPRGGGGDAEAPGQAPPNPQPHMAGPCPPGSFPGDSLDSQSVPQRYPGGKGRAGVSPKS